MYLLFYNLEGIFSVALWVFLSVLESDFVIGSELRSWLLTAHVALCSPAASRRNVSSDAESPVAVRWHPRATSRERLGARASSLWVEDCDTQLRGCLW